jgi:hypothetical protein
MSAEASLPLSPEAEEFAGVISGLDPADQLKLGRLIDALADEQQQSLQPLSTRLLSAKGREEFRRLLDEFASN